MSALKRKLIDTFMGHPQVSRGWSAVEKLVRERERAAAEKAWDKGFDLATRNNPNKPHPMRELNPYRSRVK